MKFTSKKLFTILGAIFLSCSILGCSNNSSSGGEGITSVVVSPSTLTLDLNGTTSATLKATVNGENNPSQTVTWSVVSGGSYVSISSGVVTAKKVGTAVVRATSTIDNTKYGNCTVKVVDSTPVGDGDGSEGNPYTVSQAIAIASGLEADARTSLKYFIKGKITGSVSTSGVSQYGNVNFNITDNGSGSYFICYQVLYLNKAKFTQAQADSLKSGDTVVIFSSIVNYRGNTPETTDKGSAYVYQHNDKKSSSVPEQGFPTEDPNASVRTINALISENSSWKTEGAKSTTLYRITGIAQYAVSVNYGNFDLVDSTGYIAIHGCVDNKRSLINDGDNGKVIDNDKSFASMGIQPGDEVTIEGWYAYHAYTKSYGVPQYTGYVTKLVRNGASKITPTSYTASETYTGSYYDSVSSLTGNELLKGLHNLMDSSHSKYTSYSSLDSYYKNSDPYSGGGVKCFYSGEKANSYNKEHVWPQSLSNGLYGEDYGGSDLHHIRPTISAYNSKRGSAMFGPIYGSSGYKGGSISYQGGGKDYYTSNVFEPADSIKGDVARIIMYMYMHYNDGTIKDLSSITGWNTKSYYGQMNINWVMGPNKTDECFTLLRYWNAIDPVSSDEITRNNYAAQIQGNRNPFIDHPTYADKIWG